METFNPQKFIEGQIKEIKRIIGDKKAIIAVSGGVDSTVSAVLTHRAIGENLLCVFLDDAFMREGEPERVASILSSSPLKLPVKVINVQERFLNALKGIRDAEEKRRVFREEFYQTLSEVAKKEGCRFLVQGTIKADIDETARGIKTQHNVLTQIGINPAEHYGFQVIEPVASLYKAQVRMVARQLGVPLEISERQPFPGPGLAVRAVGEIKAEKLETLKKATTIVEEDLAEYTLSQYFAAIIDNVTVTDRARQLHVQEIAARHLNVPSRNLEVKIFRDKATGVKGGKRRYGDVVTIKALRETGTLHKPYLSSLISLQKRIITEIPSFTRVLFNVRDRDEERDYAIVVRAVITRDFLTARVAYIPWEGLEKLADKILSACPDVSSVYYDVTPKPPATIEME